MREPQNTKRVPIVKHEDQHHSLCFRRPHKLYTNTILAGGSMKGANAAGLLSKPDVDGGLIGGASLTADFFNIVNACG